MIEQAMIFALGLLSMSLVALFFLPAVWGRALRLSRRRLERQIPLSMAEVTAERDRLRAECAVAQRRTEQEAERIARRRAADLAELGRRAVRIHVLEEETAARKSEIADLETTLRDTRNALTGISAEHGALVKEHYDTIGLLDRTRGSLEDFGERYRELEAAAEERRATIASLQTFIAAAQTRIEDLSERVDEDELLMRRKDHELQLTANARDAALADAAFQQARFAALESRLTTQTGQVSAVEAALMAAERGREAARAGTELHQAALREKNELIVELEGKIDELEDRLTRQSRAARVRERELLDRVDGLRAETAALEGALAARGQAAPADDDEREPDVDAMGSDALDKEDEAALLRRSILEIAAEVRRLSGGTDGLATLPKLAELKPRRERSAKRDPSSPKRGEPAETT